MTQRETHNHNDDEVTVTQDVENVDSSSTVTAVNGDTTEHAGSVTVSQTVRNVSGGARVIGWDRGSKS